MFAGKRRRNDSFILILIIVFSRRGDLNLFYFILYFVFFF